MPKNFINIKSLPNELSPENNKSIKDKFNSFNYFQEYNKHIFKTTPLKKSINFKTLHKLQLNKIKKNNFPFSRNYDNVDSSFQKFIKYLNSKKKNNKLLSEKNEDYKKKFKSSIFKDSLKIKKLSKLELDFIQNGCSLLKKS